MGGVNPIDIIYTVSPHYLSHIQKESEPFQFNIQGYGSFDVAITKLLTINIVDVLGFLIVLEELPEELDEIIDFINKCNIISNDTPLLIACKDSEGIETLFEYVEVDKLKVFISTNFEVVTDTVIRRDMFGTILKQRNSPYYLTDTPRDYIYEYKSSSRLEYTPLFNKLINIIMKPLYVADSYEKTIELDTCLEELKTNPILYQLRLYLISLKHSYRVEDYKKDCLESIESMAYPPSKDYFIYKSLYSMIEGGLI